MNKLFLLLIIFVMMQTAKSQSAESDTVWSKSIGSEVKAVKFSPDGQFIYAAAFNYKPMKIETITGNIIKEYDGFIFNYKDLTKYSMDISPDGTQLYAGGIGSCLYIWDTESGILLDSVCVDYEQDDVFPYFKSVAVNEIYIAALVADKDSPYGYIHFWNRQSKNEVKVLQVDRSNRIEFDPTGRFLAVYKLLGGSDDTGTILIDILSWTNYYDFIGHTSSVKDISFSPDGSLLASCDWDGGIKIWDVEQKKLVKEFGGNNEINSVGFIGNDKVIGGCGTFQNRYVKIWNLTTEKFLGQIKTNIQLDLDISEIKHYCVIANASSGVFLFDYEKIISGISEISKSKDDLIIPNPTNGICSISIFLPISGKTLVSIADANAREIEILHNGFIEQGEHTFLWIPKNLPTGTYFCRIIGTNFSKTLKIILER